MVTDPNCTRCGWCCHHVAIKIQTGRITAAKAEWMNARGIEIRNGFLIIPSKCPHVKGVDLTGNDDWVAACDFQLSTGPSKPKICARDSCQKGMLGIKYP